MKYTLPTNINKQKLKDVNSGSVIELVGHYYLVTNLYFDGYEYLFTESGYRAMVSLATGKIHSFSEKEMVTVIE